MGGSGVEAGRGVRVGVGVGEFAKASVSTMFSITTGVNSEMGTWKSGEIRLSAEVELKRVTGEEEEDGEGVVTASDELELRESRVDLDP